MSDDGCVKDMYPGDGNPDVVPGVAPEGRGEADAASFTLEVDGEQFAVRIVVDPRSGYTDTGYTWLSGPNDGYGFGIGGPPSPSWEQHRQRIREFLAMVDPTTGYIKEG
jgi:hypothetical protein